MTSPGPERDGTTPAARRSSTREGHDTSRDDGRRHRFRSELRRFSAATRGQAFSVEGVTAAILVTTALLISIQSVVVTPTTRGTVDEDVRTNLRQQTQDVLAIADENESIDLSGLVRYWEPTGRTFRGAANRQLGYGQAGPPGEFGRLLNETFTQRGFFYNVVVVYQTTDPRQTGRIPMAIQGRPDENAVVAVHQVTLYDNTTFTNRPAGGTELWEYDTDPTDGDEGYYPIPNAVKGPVYNVVEIRVTVW